MTPFEYSTVTISSFQVVLIWWGLQQMRAAGERRDRQLDQQGQALDQQGKALENIGQALDQQGKALDRQGQALENMGAGIQELLKRSAGNAS